MKASLTNLRISPRKVRLVTDLVKGKSVPDALAQLQFLTKRSALPIAKLINSAVATNSSLPCIWRKKSAAKNCMTWCVLEK
jgi:ribosomal protein L22